MLLLAYLDPARVLACWSLLDPAFFLLSWRFQSTVALQLLSSEALCWGQQIGFVALLILEAIMGKGIIQALGLGIGSGLGFEL